MAIDDLASRKRLTFAQAEGAAPLPSQLQRSDMPRTLRARLWGVLHAHLYAGKRQLGSYTYISTIWAKILREEWVKRSGNFPNTFSEKYFDTEKRLSSKFDVMDYLQMYDLLQFILRDKYCPPSFAEQINVVLKEEMAAYRIFDNDTFVPVASDEEASALQRAFDSTATGGFVGPRQHLKRAAEHLSSGQFADSVRESISAVESIARILEPTADLSKALGRLERSGHLHRAMKHGFSSLYGYTSDEGGIRHALLEDGDAKVDEADALFMIGACASFVSYLIAKKAAAGIEEAP